MTQNDTTYTFTGPYTGPTERAVDKSTNILRRLTVAEYRVSSSGFGFYDISLVTSGGEPIRQDPSLDQWISDHRKAST